MGPTRTVPPDPRATPRTRRQLVNDPLELDRPPATPPEPSTPPQGRPYRATPPDGTPEQLDVTGVLEPDPVPFHADVIASHSRSPEPLGRRTPEPLDAAREGVER